MAKAIFTFGRFNPPTNGHGVLADKLKSVAKRSGGKAFIFTGQSHDSERNPLDYKSKIKYMSKAFKGVTVVNNSSIRTLFEVLEYLDGKYDEVILVVGSDRVSEFRTLINKYLGDYNFKNFEVMSAGERDPDAEGARGMSASKMRAAAARDDYDAFLIGCPKRLSKRDCKQMFEDVKKGMGVSESKINEELWFNYEEFDQFCERVVSLQTRRKMARVARKTSKKRARSKERKKKFKKSTETLKAISRKKAKMLLRKKLTGDKQWGQMSIAARQKIDDMLQKKQKAVAKIAKKLYPKVKKAEKERLQRVRNPEKETQKEEIMQEREEGPLIKWMETFRSELKKAGSSYKNIDPVDALKLYYKKVDPKKAAKKLKESVELDEADITVVVDKKTRKVVFGPTGIGQAQLWVKEHGGGKKYTVMQKKGAKKGSKIPVWESLGRCRLDEMTFKFPDERKAKQFEYDISNSGVATGKIVGKTVEVTVDRGGRQVHQAVSKYMRKNKGKLVKESVELGESKMSELHMHITDGKTAEQIAKIMKIDPKTVKILMKGMKEFVELDEAEMTPAQKKKREEVVMKLKKGAADFKKQYGDRATDVMYAIATKQAMEEVEIGESHLLGKTVIVAGRKGTVTKFLGSEYGIEMYKVKLDDGSEITSPAVEIESLPESTELDEDNTAAVAKQVKQAAKKYTTGKLIVRSKGGKSRFIMVSAGNIDNALRKKVLDAMYPKGVNVRDMDNISYGNISSNIISASVDAWVKALGLKESINEADTTKGVRKTSIPPSPHVKKHILQTKKSEFAWSADSVLGGNSLFVVIPIKRGINKDEDSVVMAIISDPDRGRVKIFSYHGTHRNVAGAQKFAKNNKLIMKESVELDEGKEVKFSSDNQAKQFALDVKNSSAGIAHRDGKTVFVQISQQRGKTRPAAFGLGNVRLLDAIIKRNKGKLVASNAYLPGKPGKRFPWSEVESVEFDEKVWALQKKRYDPKTGKGYRAGDAIVRPKKGKEKKRSGRPGRVRAAYSGTGFKEFEERDYKKEYANFHGKPEQRAMRSKRVLARRKLEKEGRVKKGDGKDVDHRDGNANNNSDSNLRVMNRHTNRSRNNNK